MTAPRMAVLTPYVANLVGVKLSRGEVWGTEQWRAHALSLRAQGRGALADEVEASYAQLRESAGQWLAARELAPRGLVVVSDGADVRDDSPAFPGESVEAKAAVGEAVSAHDVVTTVEAARMLSVSRQRVGQLLRDGQLTGRRQGRSWLVERGSVEDLLDVRSTA